MIKRLIEEKLNDFLKRFGCILIYGPKLTGKTYLAEKYSNSYYYMQEYGKTNRNFLFNPINNAIFDGEYPRLIDEWQIVPEIWDKIRFLVDKSHGQKGMFIITGSTLLYDKSKIIHSGAGRIARIKILPLTYSEVSDQNNQTSIRLFDLIENNFNIDKFNTNNQNNILDFIFSGGWPSKDVLDSTNVFVSQYIESILSSNTKEQINLNYHKNIAKKILTSISRLNTSQIKISKILNDIDNSVHRDTLEKYIYFFNNMHLLFQIEHWDANNIRSKYKMRSTPKTYLCDPSIGLYMLGISSSNQLLKDLNTFGIYFENLVIRDLFVFCEANNAKLYFYRDEKGNEIDAIICFDDGRWIAIEIKLDILYDAKNIVDRMNYVIGLITPNKNINNKPSLKLVITFSEHIYKVDDTYVIPYFMLNLF